MRQDSSEMLVTGKLEDVILSCLADGESNMILRAVMDRPMTASEIESELSLTRSSVYRKIGALRGAGLLMIDSFSIRDDGKREAYYVSTFTEVRVRATDGRMELDIIESRRCKERRWFQMFFPEHQINCIA